MAKQIEKAHHISSRSQRLASHPSDSGSIRLASGLQAIGAMAGRLDGSYFGAADLFLPGVIDAH